MKIISNFQKCCQNTEETIFTTYDFTKKPNHECCAGKVYDSLTHDCCNDQVVLISKSTCSPCVLSDWSEWSECELGPDPFSGAYSHRERTFGPRTGFPASRCQANDQKFNYFENL